MNSTGTFRSWLMVVVGLFRHNIIIAFRNMWKYKSQTVISIAGLATGLTCFALSTLWIRYETSYDSAHKNSKQLYVIFGRTRQNMAGYISGKNTPVPYAAYLKETFPEISNSVSIIVTSGTRDVTIEGIVFAANIVAVDSNFFRMFDLKILDGNRDFLIPNSGKMAITQEKARQLFGNKSPIGKTFTSTGYWTYTICAVISGMPKPSNYPFDFIHPISETEFEAWNLIGANTIIELFPGTDVELFEKKLSEHRPINPVIRYDDIIIPLNKMRYTDHPAIKKNVKFQYIIIFSISGLLVVLCSLFNYFINMACRFHIRQKELALRLVYGASGRSLLAMLSVEFILIILFAVISGMLITLIFYGPFLELSMIQMDLSFIYRELLVYSGVVILVALLFLWVVLFIFKRRSLNTSIRRSNKQLFRKTSIVVQLFISMVFVFCTTIIQKQIYFLHYSHEMGFSFHNRGLIYSVPLESREVLVNQLKQIPEITDVIDNDVYSYIFPQRGNTSGFGDSSWENKPADAERVSGIMYSMSPEIIDFYDLRLVAGEKLTAADPESSVLISEDAARAYGWHDPVGKQINNGAYTVKGVVKNIYNYGPMLQTRPAAYSLEKKYYNRSADVLFKYSEGMWKSCKAKIERLIDAPEFAEIKRTNTIRNRDTIQNFEEEYNKLMKSEIALQKLFSLFSAICVLICVFGFVSLVSLTCKERRKSIAIRKINGATTGDILVVFIKEYALLLMIGAVIAFPTGYFFMQRWLEHYVKQTDIPAWIYLSILSAMALAIVLCVGHQVYKASVENPSEVIKTE